MKYNSYTKIINNHIQHTQKIHIFASQSWILKITKNVKKWSTAVSRRYASIDTLTGRLYKAIS